MKKDKSITIKVPLYIRILGRLCGIRLENITAYTCSKDYKLKIKKINLVR